RLSLPVRAAVARLPSPLVEYDAAARRSAVNLYEVGGGFAQCGSAPVESDPYLFGGAEPGPPVADLRHIPRAPVVRLVVRLRDPTRGACHPVRSRGLDAIGPLVVRRCRTAHHRAAAVDATAAPLGCDQTRTLHPAALPTPRLLGRR